MYSVTVDHCSGDTTLVCSVLRAAFWHRGCYSLPVSCQQSMIKQWRDSSHVTGNRRESLFEQAEWDCTRDVDTARPPPLMDSHSLLLYSSQTRVMISAATRGRCHFNINKCLGDFGFTCQRDWCSRFSLEDSLKVCLSNPCWELEKIHLSNEHMVDRWKD